MAGDPKNGWHNDPSGRHAERYFVGGLVTSGVRDGGVESVDAVAPSVTLASEATTAREGWYGDPLGRHQFRWFSAGMPSALVRDGERDSHDPVDVTALGEAAFAPVKKGPRLPDTTSVADGGPRPGSSVSWWDAGAGAAVEVPFRADVAGIGGSRRGGLGEMPPMIDVRLLSFAIVLVAAGVITAYFSFSYAGVGLFGLGMVLLAVVAVSAVIDHWRQEPARRFQPEVNGRPRSVERPTPEDE